MNAFALTLITAALLVHDPEPALSVQTRAKVMILGVYHFDSPNRDYVKSPRVDHLAPAKQDEIAEVLDRLAAFEPTKIVLEAVPGTTQLQRRYEAFLRDELELAGDEREQLGFRIAKQFAHPVVHMADHALGMDLGAVVALAEESGDARFLAWFGQAMADAQAMVERHARTSVRDVLVELNEPALQDRTRDLYLQLARVGHAERFAGADVLAAWYQRNFRIFTNVCRVLETPADRVLVIFGQGHAPYLRELVRSSPDMELVEANAYLTR